MSSMTLPRPSAQTAMTTIFMAVAFYWVISISMVFVNKTLLSGEGSRIDAPLFIMWYQCVCTVFACYVLGELGFQNIPKFEVRREVLRQILPLSCVFTCMIVSNNLCLKYVEVSFYQVARSLTIAFNVVFDFIILGQRTSLPAIGCCAVVISGFLIGNKEELRWSLHGVAFGVTSSFFVALYAIMMKKVFKNVEGINGNPWKLTLYNNINASVLFLPLIVLAGEPPHIADSENIHKISFWAMMTSAGVLGVLISFASAAQVKYTSPLTHNVSATAKAAFQTVLALMWYKNPITPMGGASVGIVLFGSMLYTLVRRSEMKKKMAEEAKAEETDKQGLLSATNGEQKVSGAT